MYLYKQSVSDRLTTLVGDLSGTDALTWDNFSF